MPCKTSLAGLPAKTLSPHAPVGLDTPRPQVAPMQDSPAPEKHHGLVDRA